MNIKYKFKTILLGLLPLLLLFPSCEIDEVDNPNGPSLESLLDGASLADLQLLANGIESVMRADMAFYYQTVSIVGREYWDLNGTDPRYTGELLGQEGASLDNNGFLSTRAFAAHYKTIRNANTLIAAVPNNSASLTTEQESAFNGYAKTIQAYQLLLVLNRHERCRLEVSDPDNLGPFVDYANGLQGVMDLLDEAVADLGKAGDEFPFSFSSGWASLDEDSDDFSQINTSEFIKFNRAIAARVALYQGSKSTALSMLNASFFDPAGDLDKGAYHVFGSSGNDIRNPLFYVPNSDLYIAHPDWLASAEADDERVATKSTPLDPAEIDVPVTLADLSGDTQVSLYSSDIAPVGIIRNEELMLIYAEANIGTNNAETRATLDYIRDQHGLGPATYDDPEDATELLDQVLHERRYSLFGEGHRWIDMKRNGRIGDIISDRPGDVVHEVFPTPVTEAE